MTNENSNFQILMRQAVRNCVEEEFFEFRTGDVSGVTVHPRIRRKVKAAIRRMYLRSSVGWQILRRSVAACLVIVTVAFASAMCIQPVRAAFWNAIVTWYEDYIGILFISDGEYPAKIQERKFPEIPDGWDLVIVGESDINGLYEITGPAGEYVAYEQRVCAEISQGYDNTECNIREILLNGNTKAHIITYYQDEALIITWIDQYEYTLLGEIITEEQLIAIAETIK
ncbi:MAG: hypothetical protein IKY52_14475 [Clostridia bacterium]|nr:hypothetical protein [Clostridia bacterium]